MALTLDPDPASQDSDSRAWRDGLQADLGLRRRVTDHDVAVVDGLLELVAELRTEAEQLQNALVSRAVIEQAKGILIGQRHCSPDAAFELLKQISMDTNVKLYDVAEAVVAQALERAPDPETPPGG
jgi:hypothetical protein